MPIRFRLASLWLNLIQKGWVEQELTEEVEAYLEMLIETKIKKVSSRQRHASRP